MFNINFRLTIHCTIFILIGTLLPWNLLAQRYPFHNLSVDDGLMQSQATGMAQDKEGNLWISTLGGLSRYDGRNFTNFGVQNGLPTNAVWAIAVDSLGNIWSGSQAGLARFNGKKFTNFSRPLSTIRAISNSQQIQIIADTIWWRIGGEIYFLNKNKLTRFPTPNDSALINCMLVEKSGIWIAKDSGVYHYNHKTWDTLRLLLKPEEKKLSISRIFRERGGNIWFTTNAGLGRIDSGGIVAYKPLSQAPNALTTTPNMTAIAQDKGGALWIGTNNGMLKLTDGTFEYYNKHNGLCDNTFLDVMADAEGNIWMASDGQGIYRFSGTQFTGLDETMGLPSAQVMAIASNKKDSLFIGTYDAGLYLYKDGKVKAIEFPSRPTPPITSLCYSSRNKLWIGTRGRGLWSYQNEIWRQYAEPERNFPSNFINSLYEDTAHNLWVGFANGAMVFDKDVFKTVVTKNSATRSFLTIGRDSTLISNENGLLLYSNGLISDFKTNTIADSAQVQCFLIKDRTLWLGSSDRGLFRYNMDTRKASIINKKDGLRSEFIYNIVGDDEGNIWVGTGFGIHKIKINDKNEPEVTFFGKAQGITGMESNINSVLKMPDGGIWFGTTNGALHYQPHTVVVNSAPTSIVLQSVKLLGEGGLDPTYYDSLDKWHDIPYHLRLPFKKNNITFTFQAITLSGEQDVLYRYRMEGLDESPCSDWCANNSVTYSALPPGKYIFHVECRGRTGQPNPVLDYPFEIITPFRKTNLFRFSVLITALLSGIFLQYIVNSRKQRRTELLARLRSEEQSKIRLRTAEDFHDEIGNKLTRINVLTNVLKNKIPLTPESERILHQIEDNTSQLYSGTRDILWSLKPSNDNLFEILHHIRDFGCDLFMDTEVEFTFTGTDEKWRNYRLPMDMSRNLIMIFKEALNNCLKYSGAKNVSLEVSLKNRNVLQMILKDDGAGFDTNQARKGNGINNMNVRTARLNGRLYVDSKPGRGTIINLTFKVPLPPRKGR